MTRRGSGQGPAVGELVRGIERLARLVRQAAQGAPEPRLFEPAPRPGNAAGGSRGEAGAVRRDARQEAAAPGWWVLAQGGVLDPEDFAAREAVREELLAEVRESGVLAGENVWVWDETGRAQLVLATLPTRERAQRVAERLREKGLRVVVRREMP